jgi:hypothetical protein
MALGLVGLLGCDDVLPLADMVDKQLYLGSFIDGFNIDLFANGCPLLIPGTVRATMNGHEMTVDPGRHGSGFAGDAPCYQPSFRIRPLPDDLGTVMTFVIEDRTETLRVVIGGYHPDVPVLEAAPAGGWMPHRGDRLSVSFTPPAEPPDDAHASFSEDGQDNSGPPCFYEDEADASVANEQVSLEVPTTLCFGPAWMWLCVGYAALPHLDLCENATCHYDPSEIEACAGYPLLISQ